MTNRTAVRTIIEALTQLKQSLENTEQQFKILGRYETSLLAGTTELSSVPLTLLAPSYNSLKEAAQALQQLDSAGFDPSLLPDENTSFLYTSLRDTIYRFGKPERGGVNRSRKGLVTSNEHIYLGHPPGIWRQNVKWILEKWDTYFTTKPEYLKGYTLEAWGILSRQLELTKKITLLAGKLQ